MGEVRQQRQRQQTVGDGATEGPACRPLGIDVNPLMVVGGVGEEVDTILGDLQPFGWPELTALRRRKLVKTLEDFHCNSSRNDADPLAKPHYV